jgi:hypothetical protein
MASGGGGGTCGDGLDNVVATDVTPGAVGAAPANEAAGLASSDPHAASTTAAAVITVHRAFIEEPPRPSSRAVDAPTAGRDYRVRGHPRLGHGR